MDALHNLGLSLDGVARALPASNINLPPETLATGAGTTD